MSLNKLLSRITRKISTVTEGLSRKLYRTTDEKRKDAWFADGAETTLRLDYDLTPESVVFDVGGYEGHWASDLFSKFCCTIHVFEPVKPFSEKIAQRFARNGKIVSHAFGLAGENKVLTITVDAYASSVFKGGSESEQITLVDAVEYMDKHQIDRVDLMKVNIEGGEYELLERLIDSGYIRRVRDLQVQFHDFVPDASVRMRQLQDKLSATHATTYQYPFVWENWRLKTSVLTDLAPTRAA